MTESKKVFKGLILLNITNIRIFMHVRVSFCVFLQMGQDVLRSLSKAQISASIALTHVLSHRGTCRGVYKHCVLFHVSVHIHKHWLAQPTVMHIFNPFRAHTGKSFLLHFKSNTS